MKISNEAKIGFMIVCVLCVLAALTWKAGDFNFSKEGYELKVYFNNVDGVKKNAPVMLNGLEVGRVNDINIHETDNNIDMELTVWLDQSAKVRQGTQAFVKNMGFMGEKYVNLTTGDKGAPFLKPGEKIQGKDPADIDSLLLDGQEIAKQIKSITTNVNERLTVNKDHIDSIMLNMDQAMIKINSIADRVDHRIAANEQNVDDIISNLRTSSINLDQFTYDLKQNPWKLMYRSKEKRRKSIEMLRNENTLFQE